MRDLTEFHPQLFRWNGKMFRLVKRKSMKSMMFDPFGLWVRVQMGYRNFFLTEENHRKKRGTFELKVNTSHLKHLFLFFFVKVTAHLSPAAASGICLVLLRGPAALAGGIALEKKDFFFYLAEASLSVPSGSFRRFRVIRNVQWHFEGNWHFWRNLRHGVPSHWDSQFYACTDETSTIEEGGAQTQISMGVVTSTRPPGELFSRGIRS